MNQKYSEFVESVPENSRKTMTKYSWIGDFPKTITSEELKQIIIDKLPKNKREITVMLNTAARYASYCNNEYLLKVIEEVRAMGRTNIWTIAKPNAEKIYISNKEFETAMIGLNPNDPDEEFEENTLYYRTLFWAVYEGIFNYNMSILENLRASDIDLENKSVTLRDDKDNAYIMDEMPEQLLIDLIQCSKLLYWEQKKRGNSLAKYDMVGKYPDACFKAVSTKAKQNLRAGYTAKLKKITTNYYDGQISPTRIYYSGIAYRVAERLKVNDIPIKEAFRPNNNSFFPKTIIEQELKRSHYGNTSSKFKEIIDSHLEIMEDI